MLTSSSSSILIVDDNPTNLEVLSEALSDAGFQVSVALDGESAIDQAQYYQPELVLLDVMMPGIDGFETCQRLKANPTTRDIPVIFMTALADTEHKVRGLTSGAIDYITKPFQQEEVLARVRLQLNLRNLSKTLELQNVKLKQEIAEREAAQTALQTLTKDLERRVEERTAELSQALQNLQVAQSQLVHGEKLATLGQLVAGVAHEINNPVNFIHGNIVFATDYIRGVLDLLQLYQTQFPDKTPEIQQLSETLDLEFIQSDLPSLLTSMKVGTDRIREIVRSLRTFARHDEAEIKRVDLHDGIDSALMILNSRLKPQQNYPAIQIIREYGDLPSVECYPGQLNQVFMNILNNAIDAVEEAMVYRSVRILGKEADLTPPTIRICTALTEHEHIAIRIADSGLGMPEEIKRRIFEPFFTTKPAGKGTGLGLSISHQIVAEKHQGNLECYSIPGQGTEFVIRIPMSQSMVSGVANVAVSAA
nr:response regulator [Leptolyngbya sp. 'hensonii']